MRKIAILFRGGVSNVYGQTLSIIDNTKNKYVNYHACYLSIQKHIVKANPEYSCDFFIHCWNTDLEKDLIELYKPVKYTFEDNSLYEQDLKSCLGLFNQASQSLSIKKGIELIQSTAIDYHQILIYRPDILLIKDLLFDHHPYDYIYVNNWHNCNAEEFFLMNLRHADKFKRLYDRCRDHSIPARSHEWFKNYVETFMGEKLYGSHIKGGKHLFIIRRLLKAYKKKLIQLDQLEEFGLTEKEIRSYTAM